MYRKLTKKEIAQLEAQGCRASDWRSVEVHPDFSPEYVHQVTFSGNIRLGRFNSIITLAGGIRKHSGLYRVSLHNCETGDDVFIENIHNYIANYKIGEGTWIQNVNCIVTDGKSAFGNGVEVAVLNEAGGKEVKINDHLSSHIAYILTLYRRRPELLSKLNGLIDSYVRQQISDKGEIGKNVRIVNAGEIRNVRVGDHARIEGAGRLENGSINSNEYDPVYVGYQVIAKDFIACSGSKIEEGVNLTRCFVGQACLLGQSYSASDSLFFSNCHLEKGEACAIFAGPYTVSHHKSTLLIAGLFSFLNVGSGSNQSNHTYKLGPVHQGIVERGGKMASDSYLFLPAQIGAYSLIMGRHYGHPNTSDMPFSYLIENDEKTLLMPGASLRSVGTLRDAQKFSKRDKRKDPHRLDQIHFNMLSPYIVQKIQRGVEILKDLQEKYGEEASFYPYQNCRINRSALVKGLDLYDKAIRHYLGNVLISRLENHAWKIDQLQPDSEAGSGNWCDWSGLFLPETLANDLFSRIESGKIAHITEVNDLLSEIHQHYVSYEWTWAYEQIQSYYGLTGRNITDSNILSIIKDWKEAAIDLDRMLYEDAKKEFVYPFEFEPEYDDFGKNEFVLSILRHIEEITKLENRLIKNK